MAWLSLHDSQNRTRFERMKRTIITALTLGLLGTTLQAENAAPSPSSPIAAPASRLNVLDHRFEVGVIFGEPTGLSTKYWLNETIAVDGGVGWSFENDTDVELHADVLWHNFEWLPVPQGALSVYFGVGARGQLRNPQDDRAGIRLPIGISYLFQDVPLSVFAEVAPVLDVVPSAEANVMGGIGVRYRF